MGEENSNNGKATSFCEIQKIIKKGKRFAIENYLNEGGDPNIVNENGWSILMLAAFYGRFDVCELLIRSGAIVALQNKIGETAEALALNKGHKQIARFIRERDNTTN